MRKIGQIESIWSGKGLVDLWECEICKWRTTYPEKHKCPTDPKEYRK